MTALSFLCLGGFLANKILILSFYLSLILPSVLSLQVAPGSNCTAICTGHFLRTNTTGNDIVCYDQDYNSSLAGSSFKDCVTCELGSVTFDHQTNQTDIGWALCTYILRFYPQLLFGFAG